MGSALADALLLSALAGAMIPLGAALARIERIRPLWLETEVRHTVIAFGAGALLAAVALVLVPEGAARLPPPVALLLFALGAVLFMGADILLKARLGGGAQALAMLLDFVPEAMALGALATADAGAALLLALLIGLQNLPEGFNAFRELRAAAPLSPGRLLGMFCGLALLGPLAALAGVLFLADRGAALGGIMMLAAGGILFLTIADIVPKVPLRNRHAPPLGAVAGFLLALAGHLYMP